jgi:hypothetical protein
MYDGHNKTFIFLSYEGLYLRQQTPQTFQYSPDFCIQQTTAVLCSEVPAPLQPVLNTFPFSSSSEIIDAAGNPTGLARTVIFGSSFPSHVNATSIRVDHTFSSKLSVFFRYGDTPSYGQTSQLWSKTDTQVDTHTFTFGATSQLSTIRSNELRARLRR